MEENKLSLELASEKLKNKTQECKSPDTKDKAKEYPKEGHRVDDVEETGRERLKRLREEVMMEKLVNIPENWGQEQKLKDWIDYTMCDALFAPHSLILTARDALIANGKAKSPRLKI